MEADEPVGAAAMRHMADPPSQVRADHGTYAPQRTAAAALSVGPEFTRLIETARAEERLRIAQDIHDELGAVLMAIKVELKCSAKSATPGRRAIDQQWSIMLAHVDAALATVARIAEELRPSIVASAGLRTAVESYVREFEEIAKIPCTLHIDCRNDAIQDEAAADVFRVLQEALINVARHAEASRIDIRVNAGNGQLVLEISDNGRGIVPAQILSPRSVGIAGMFDRARQVGGKLQIEGRPGEGTIVRLRLALESMA